MSCHINHNKLAAMLIAAILFSFPGGAALAQGASSVGKLNPYLADCYRNVTYRGKLEHHFSITLPHTKTCSVDQGHLPPGLSLKRCDVEGVPTAPGKWDLQVLLEAKCNGINFGKVSIPVTIRIEE